MVEETLGCEAQGLALPLTVTLAPGLHASPLVPLLPSCHELTVSVLCSRRHDVAPSRWAWPPRTEPLIREQRGRLPSGFRGARHSHGVCLLPEV